MGKEILPKDKGWRLYKRFDYEFDMHLNDKETFPISSMKYDGLTKKSHQYVYGIRWKTKLS